MPATPGRGDGKQPRVEEGFAAALRFAVERSGIPLDRIRERLRLRGTPVSVATLSYWQTGRSQPERQESRRALKELESVLGVDPGYLTGRLGAPRPRGRRAARSVDRASLMPRAELVRQALGDFGFAEENELSRLSTHDVARVSASGVEVEQLVRHLHRAEVDGASRFPIIHMGEEDDTAAPELEPVMGCHSRRAFIDDSAALLVAEMLLLRPLARGELAMTEHRVRWEDDEEPETRHERSTPAKIREVLLCVTFHPDMVPASCEGYTHIEGEETAWPLYLDEGHSVQLILLDFGPGACGIRWTW